MESPSLDEFVALNEQLSALLEAGVPLNIGLGRQGQHPREALAKINSTVVYRVHNGESLAEALEGDEQSVPSGYRSLIELGMRSGALHGGLSESTLIADSVDRSRKAIRSALFYPLLICLLAYLGLILLSHFFIPSMESSFQSLRIRPGWGLSVLHAVRASMPYWIFVPPVLLGYWSVRRLRSHWKGGGEIERSMRRWSWVPGVSQAIAQQRYAIFSESLGTLLQSNTPMDEGMRIAAGICEDVPLSEGARALATALKQGHFPADNGPVASRFPPFLRWAIWHGSETLGRERALAMAADFYRQSAQRRYERLRGVIPIVLGILIGGGITLLYGLLLFVPVVQLYESLAS